MWNSQKYCENNFMSDEMWNEFLIKIEQNKNKNENIK